MQGDEVETFRENSLIKLTGYTSTSKSFDKALEFALVDCEPEQMPVVFEIFFNAKHGLFELDDGITAYPGEQEVLL